MDDNATIEANNDQAPTPAETKPEAHACKHVPIIIVLVLLLICSTACAIVEYVTLTQDKEPVAEREDDDDDMKQDLPIPQREVTPDCGQSTTPDGSQEGQSNTTITVTIHAKHGFKELRKGTTESYPDSAGYTAIIMDEDFYTPNENNIVFTRSNKPFSGIVPTKNINQEFSFDGEVTRAMVGLFGNGGYEAILLQFTDGTVAAIDLDYQDMTFKAIKHLDGVSGVTALYKGYEGTGAQVFAVDVNGKAIGLYDKIWKD